jgi:hypothetical protein
MDIITSKFIQSLKTEINNEHNSHIIKEDIIKPMIENILSEIYPYIFIVCGIFLILFICIISIFILNIKIYYHK